MLQNTMSDQDPCNAQQYFRHITKCSQMDLLKFYKKLSEELTISSLQANTDTFANRIYTLPFLTDF